MTSNTMNHQLKLIALTLIATPVYICTILLILATALTVLTIGSIALTLTSPMRCYNMIKNYYEDRKKFKRAQ